MPVNDDKRTEAGRKALEYAQSLSDEDDARLDAAANGDPDSKPWSDEMWARAETLDERKRGQAKSSSGGTAAKHDDLEIDADVLEHFRKTGRGWQERINDVLRKAAGLGRG